MGITKLNLIFIMLRYHFFQQFGQVRSVSVQRDNARLCRHLLKRRVIMQQIEESGGDDRKRKQNSADLECVENKLQAMYRYEYPSCK